MMRKGVWCWMFVLACALAGCAQTPFGADGGREADATLPDAGAPDADVPDADVPDAMSDAGPDGSMDAGPDGGHEPLPPIKDLLLARGPAVVIAGQARPENVHRASLSTDVQAVALDEAHGRTYLVDAVRNRVLAIDAQSERTSTVAGNGLPGYAGDGGAASEALLSGPRAVAVGTDGSLLIADTGNQRVRHIAVNGAGSLGVISTLLFGVEALDVAFGPGDRAYFLASDGVFEIVDGAASRVGSVLTDARGFAIDGAGDIYICDGSVVRRFAAAGGQSVVAGDGTSAHAGDGGLAVNASLLAPQDVFVSTAGELFIVDAGAHVVRKVDGSGIISTVAGLPEQAGFAGDGGSATAALLDTPSSVWRSAAGELLIADSGNRRIRRVRSDDVMETFAGLGDATFYGEGISGLEALLSGPLGLSVHPSSRDLYFADRYNRRIRRVTPFGTIHTVAGGGTQRGEGISAVQARLQEPSAVAVDTEGRVLFSDVGDRRIAQVDSGIVRTVLDWSAGAPLTTRFEPTAFCVDGDALYVVSAPEHSVYRYGLDDESLVRVAGTGQSGDNGDGISGSEAMLNNPRDVACGPDGQLYIADTGNHRVRKLSQGIIETVAGVRGESGYNGDGRSATSAWLKDPISIALNGAGRLHIADQGNFRVRIVRDGQIQTVIGNGCALDDLACTAQVSDPDKVGIDPRHSPLGRVLGIALRNDGFLLFSEDNDRILSLETGRSGAVCLLDVDGDGVAKAQTDGNYIFRSLLGLGYAIPAAYRTQYEEERAQNPNLAPLPTDAEVHAAVAALRGDPELGEPDFLDVDGNGMSSGGGDGVYIYRYLVGEEFIVPPLFRMQDPSIRDDVLIEASLRSLCQ